MEVVIFYGRDESPDLAATCRESGLSKLSAVERVEHNYGAPKDQGIEWRIMSLRCASFTFPALRAGGRSLRSCMCLRRLAGLSSDFKRFCRPAAPRNARCRHDGSDQVICQRTPASAAMDDAESTDCRRKAKCEVGRSRRFAVEAVSSGLSGRLGARS